MPEVERVVPHGFLCLVSADGFEFLLEEEYAFASTVINKMMQSQFKESRTRVVELPRVSARALEKICQYLFYIPRYRDSARLSDKPCGDIVGMFDVPRNDVELIIDLLEITAALDL